ncbi:MULTISPECIES: hypothetical protein [unclassified Rathayibacter]|uniref:hypothetical protein n=1 Tax=unclassified Rathayibacter TaxID=2609250 RepID=UPI0010431EA7|nr:MULTISPECIES: hypothetical protein [unclassified Rathayibacter]MCJ1703688.1 hypothetical protein [Rathayibacter sp. VKM Ac-2926]TCL84337.1 hypothetical protein EDF49_1021 [Rathayibacter sp. PhB192]TCM30055.1 hypothetical protein EDF43_1021 [Rathayibacter sp. PhB179]
MGDTLHIRRPIASRLVATALGLAVAAVALAGCTSGGGAEAQTPAPTVTVTVEPTARGTVPGEQDTSVSYVCGRYSSLLSIGWTMQWFHDRGDVSDEAYQVFLERQAFQLQTVRMQNPEPDETGVSAASSGIRTYLQDAQAAAGRWTYDPSSPEWSTLQSDLGVGCAAAGSTLASYAEPEMGG